MKSLRWTILLSMSVFLSGCLYCFNPPYNPEEVIEEPRLLGEWQDKDGKNRWTIKPLAEKTYQITVQYDEDPSLTYAARLFRLNNEDYLDFFPEEKAGEGTLFDRQLAPFHMIMKVRWREEGFEAVQLNIDWLDKARKEKRIKLKTAEIEGGAEILASSRKENRELLLKHGEEAFGPMENGVNVMTLGHAKN